MDNTNPRVPAYLVVVKHPWARRFAVGWLWKVKCPFCGRAHVHGGGNILEGPASLHLGLRVPHCLNSAPTDYCLVDADPARTVKIKTEAQGEVRKAAAGGNGAARVAQKIINRARAELAAR